MELIWFLFRNPLVIFGVLGLILAIAAFMFFKPWFDLVLELLKNFFQTKAGKRIGNGIILGMIALAIFSWGRNYEYRIGKARQLERENAELKQSVKTLEQSAILTQQIQATSALAEAETQEAWRVHQSKAPVVICPYDPADLRFYDQRLRGRK